MLRSIPHGSSAGQTRPARLTRSADQAMSRTGSLSQWDKGRIYEEWLHAGRPHNVVCSKCRMPGNLLLCETCCRSYHASCLPAEIMSPGSPLFCPSCKEKQWDQDPPRFDPPEASSNISRASTPSGVGLSKGASPSGRTPSTSLNWPGTQRSLQSSPESGRPPGIPSPGPFRARDFLIEYGGFPADQDFRPELLLKLESMMTDLEAQFALQQEAYELREENAALRSQVTHLRSSAGAQPPSREPIVNPAVSHIPPILPRPTPDTSGKSWDRIVTEFF
ncbi:hypothetical protein BDW42DRAFT_47440 [Aspergillus taichungensis]|uniref:PHD-type domain-containing protein n=1 Tax=Aspergillus taichungensis TaxID=482145 RepID=A0A2J5HDP7_9EURO|nr:hypothetical protein BDW42DRAFT_47440 [Aspergillus taichungensis]